MGICAEKEAAAPETPPLRGVREGSTSTTKKTPTPLPHPGAAPFKQMIESYDGPPPNDNSSKAPQLHRRDRADSALIDRIEFATTSHRQPTVGISVVALRSFLDVAKAAHPRLADGTMTTGDACNVVKTI